MNNIEVVGDFNEICLMPKIDENLEERSLVKIEMLKKILTLHLVEGLLL